MNDHPSRLDKFDLMQDLAAETFVKIASRVSTAHSWFDSLYLTRPNLQP